MWRLLNAELSSRLRPFAAWCAGTLAMLGGLILITEPHVPVLDWGISIMAAVPLLINFTAGISDVQQHRLRQQVLLPITLRQVALVRLLVPVILQILGGGLAVACAIGGLLLQRGSGNWMLALWLTCVFILLGQAAVSHRELRLNQRWKISKDYIAPLLGTALTALVLAMMIFLAKTISGTIEVSANCLPWQKQLPYLLALAATLSIQFFVNLSLFQRRDASLN